MRNEVLPALPRSQPQWSERNEIEFRRELEDRLRAMLERLPTPLVKTATWDAGSIADGAVTTTTVTVRGAKVGDPVSVGLSSLTTQDAIISANVQSANTVQVVLFNKNGAALDLASGSLRVVVWKV